MSRRVDDFAAKPLKLRSKLGEPLRRKCVAKCLIFCLAYFTIKDTKCLIVESDTGDTVSARSAIIDHNAGRAIAAVTKRAAIVTLEGRHPVVAQLTAVHRKAVDNVLARDDVIAVQTVLVICTTYNEITVLLIESMARVVAVLT